jgi:hypothetical protein
MDQQRFDVAFNCRGTDKFGKASLSDEFPQFHLEKPILCGDETLCEKQVMLVTCMDVSDAPAIALDPYGVAQTRDLVGSMDDGEALGSALLPVSVGGSYQR